MAFAPPIKAKASSNLAKSTWTPMNHPEANLQVFEERRELVQKWFQKWHDPQKRVIVDDILKNLSQKHLVSLHETLNCKFPQERFDFTRILPRVLTLYLFSFLDPRTLCRCAQVSWYWSYLSEMDCLWRPKCLKFGWYPTYQPSPFEEKIWKRFYVSTVHELNFAKIKSIESRSEAEGDARLNTARSTMSKASVAMSTTSSITGLRKGPTVPSTKKPLSAPKWQPPPWKGSDPRPLDTMRYNYLDNMGNGKKKTTSPGQRPSSRHGRRPHTSAGSRHKSEVTKQNVEESRRSYGSPLDKTTRLSGEALANYAAAGTVPSPRLNKDFQFPQYNGNDATTSGHVGMPSGGNSSKFAPTTITSQINWNPSRNSHESMTNPRSYEKTSSYHGKLVSPSASRGDHATQNSEDFSRMSLDAGVRPQPVSKFTPEKSKRSKDGATENVEKENSSAKQKSNVKGLEGKGWAAPANSASDDEF